MKYPIIKNIEKTLADGYEKDKLILVFTIPFSTSLYEVFGLILEEDHKTCIKSGPLSRQHVFA